MSSGDANGHLKAEADAVNTITATYIWGGNRLLAKKLASGAQYYYLYNGHGDVVQITDSAGNIVNSYEYDEWGNITSQTEGIENEFKYAGQTYDSETGLYYLRARYYDPTTGRFISKDSNEGSIVNPLSLNLYTYCENNPTRYVDPSGNNPAVLWALYVYATAVANSPDTQQDLMLISNDLANADYLSAGLDLVGLLVPGGTGFGQLSKPARNGIIWLAENTGKSVDEILEMVTQSNKVINESKVPKVADREMDNIRLLNKARIKGYTVSLDLERGGSKLNNIHVDVNGTKYTYSASVQAFVDSYGNRLPHSLRGNKEIINAFTKAQEKIGQGW